MGREVFGKDRVAVRATNQDGSIIGTVSDSDKLEETAEILKELGYEVSNTKHFVSDVAIDGTEETAH